MQLTVRMPDEYEHLRSKKGEKAILEPFVKKSLLDFYGAMPTKRKYPGFEATRREVHQKISETVYSFDRHFDRVAGIERLEPPTPRPGGKGEFQR